MKLDIVNNLFACFRLLDSLSFRLRVLLNISNRHDQKNQETLRLKSVPDDCMHASNYFIKTFDVFRILL